MSRWRIDISYDGSDFEGWQTQLSGRTIQDELEKALAKILGTPITVTGAGRTDSGVHARCQTAHFDAEAPNMKGDNFLHGMNSLLPWDIRILRCIPVDDSFNSRFSALARVYHYHLLPHWTVQPWENRYAWRVYPFPDLEVLNSMARTLRGELDFTAFTHAQDPNDSRHRFIYHSLFYPQKDQVIFRISGNAFLWRMVRSLVGTMVTLASKGKGTEEFLRILNSKDRKQAGPTAPAQGLFLQKVIYHVDEFSY